ncbi:Helicase associated domain protein [Streptomyces actinomycinicus]|uniref:Helicase associated domain protein n=1 Tax=Streptomyces actinomycinicus TaxID=1695166 RepID=A0A937ERH3_9ACTN|nr:DEAD/DEAH box helicase [Streptomyces actinomycinicus]MBL1086765.1 Helicase associated domain protein [Streptomyces actinomycinicus]
MQTQPLVALREHQTEAVTSAVPALEIPTGSVLPPDGLRTQVIQATGSGKTYVAVHVAQELKAARVLVLMPSRPLLTQTAAAWRLAGRPGPAIGVSSLRQSDVGFPNTTNPAALTQLLKDAGDGPVTVYGTYASLGTIEAAHQMGLQPWDLIVIDEAHRTSGRMGKPWALVHDNSHIPASARLYMTATPRLWAAGDDNGETDTGESGAAGELVASMDDDPNGTFGAVSYKLTLSDAIDRGIVAPYQVLCIEIQDPQLQTLQLAADGDVTEAVRAARLAALQTAALKSAVEHEFQRVLTFHSRLDEAEAFSDGLLRTATALVKEDPERYPHPDTLWTTWLSGDHKADHRARTLREFAADREGPAFLSSVKVLGEGVDTRECDAVFFADVRGSMPDLVQAVGRALRMHPGEGKLATIAVPVILGAGESPDELLSSPAYAPLAKLLTALRAHDSRIIEALASPSTPSRPSPTEEPVDDNTPAADTQDTDGDDNADDTTRGLLSFSTAHDPRQIAAFIGMRVLNPEKVHWRRGIQAATRYLAEYDDLRVPYGYRTPTDWSPADFPLGVWVADLRRYYHEGTLAPERIEQAEKLGMIWSEFDAAFEEGLAAAAAWAADHHVGLAAPTDAMQCTYPVGKFLSNQRAAARRAEVLAHHQAEGTTAPDSGTVPLTDPRRQALEDIDPGWCPPWPIDWQRHFRRAWHHLQTGGTLPAKAGEVIIDGADIGKWLAAQARAFTKLTVTQQWMLTDMLHLTPAPTPRKLTRAEQRALNLAAARQFHAREGHLDVPRSHREPVDGTDVGLGSWINNVRARQASQPDDLKVELTALGMRWA